MHEQIIVDASEITLSKLASDYSDEDKARALFESWRWPNGVCCPFCGNDDVYKINVRKTNNSPARAGVYCCAGELRQFTARVKTVLEDSKISYSKWIMAIFILCSSKKSVSANQMHRMLGVTYKTAWFMCHRIRHAISSNSMTPKLGGIVEVDECFIGGVGDAKTKILRKTPVVALVERGGNMRTSVVSNVTQKNIGRVLSECVSKNASVHTDENTAYKNPLKEWSEHHKVVHSKYEFTKRLPDGTKVSVNSAESFFSLLKRGVHGSWHHVSREHLPKYAEEFAFRWNHRNITDGERTKIAAQCFEGKRMTYNQVTLASNP